MWIEERFEVTRIPNFKNYSIGDWFLYCPNGLCSSPKEGSANCVSKPRCDTCGSRLRIWEREAVDEAFSARCPSLNCKHCGGMQPVPRESVTFVQNILCGKPVGFPTHFIEWECRDCSHSNEAYGEQIPREWIPEEVLVKMNLFEERTGR